MGLNGFILECEKENKYLKKDVEYYKNKSIRLEAKLKKQKEIIDKAIEMLEIGIHTYNKGGSRTALFECIDATIFFLEDKEV